MAKWFSSGRGRRSWSGRTRNRRAIPTLDVRARTRQRKKKPADAGRWAGFATVAIAVVVVVGAVWFVLHLVGGLLFSRNDHFTIRQVAINSDDVVAIEYIRGKRKIAEGNNLFGFDIRDVRRDFLRSAPNYRSMEITRILADRLQIDLVARKPVARFGRRGGFVVDRQGVVFGLRAASLALPKIFGYSGPLLRPGDRVEGSVSDAVDVIEGAREIGLGAELSITGIDIRGGNTGTRADLLMFLEGSTTVNLWWNRAGKQAAAEEDLRGRLLYLGGVLRKAKTQGTRLRTVNLTLDNYRDNCPVTFWN